MMENYSRHDVYTRYEELSLLIQSENLSQDKKKYQSTMKEYARLSDLLTLCHKEKKLMQEIEELQEVLLNPQDSDLHNLVEEEKKQLEEELETTSQKINLALIPPDPHDERPVLLEIRAGTGGQEAALFAADIFRMYQRYCEKRSWSLQIISCTESELNGFKEIVFHIPHAHAYRFLKWEKGTHRVQRIPVTESNGRLQTSAITVVVFPEVEETEVDLMPQDLRIDTFRAQGAGGQHVNTTDSAVRITHIPTQIVVSCQDERSQIKNKAKAMKILRSRLFEFQKEKQKKVISQNRKQQVGSGDRSERIRTYNFPQNRLSDHRIGLVLYTLDKILDGDLDPLIQALREKLG